MTLVFRNVNTVEYCSEIYFIYCVTGKGGGDGISGGSSSGGSGSDGVVLDCPKCGAPLTHIETFEGKF